MVHWALGPASLWICHSKASWASLPSAQKALQALSKGFSGMVHRQLHGGSLRICLILSTLAPLDAYELESHDVLKPWSDSRALSFKETSPVLALDISESEDAASSVGDLGFTNASVPYSQFPLVPSQCMAMEIAFFENSLVGRQGT